jgi:hypothetical protein
MGTYVREALIALSGEAPLNLEYKAMGFRGGFQQIKRKEVLGSNLIAVGGSCI